MKEEGKAFLKKLDELIDLFEKLREKATKDGIILHNDPMYKNFELLAGNYKMIKDTIPEDLIEDIGEPIKDMITEMIAQLKQDLDMDYSDTENTISDELKQIDQLLKQGNLSETEINNLLDKRSKLNPEE